MKKSKKICFLILFSILLISLFFIQVKALEAEDFNPDKWKEEGEGKWDYLKKEWKTILIKDKFFGPIIQGYEKISPYTDPIFKYTVGVTPSFSWLFILTFILWIAFFVYIYRIFHYFSFFSEWVGIIISLALIVVISMLGTIKKLAEFIIDKISLFGEWWVQLIVVLLLIVALVIASIYSKQVEKFMKEMKKRREKMKEELRRLETELGAKEIKALSKAIEKGLKNK